MATYKQVGYGSQGSEVTELQKLLNSTGSYNLDTDGIFGEKTQAAVMDYQKNNNLDVDGIVGDNTWGALTKANASSSGSSSSASAESAPAETKSPAFEYEAYQPSDTVAQAEALLQQQLANKPGSYQSAWQDQLAGIIQNIQNRDKFSYNVNEDALYQQLKDQYVMQGQQASMDVMGQAATLTGGFGSSFSQTAGQQAYQSYLQQLNDRVPELYGMALDQYNQEGQALYDQAALLAQMEDQDYGRYRDQISDYYAELDRRTEDARYQGEQDYGRYMDGYNMAYGQYRDQTADQQWQTEFDESQRQYDEQMALAREQWDWERAQAALAGGGGGGGGNGGDGGDAPTTEFEKAIFSRVDENGNYVFYIDGKERTYAPGVNPYTGTKNSDTKYGTFSNGYQPNNIGGKKLTKTGITDVVNGVTQNVWKTPDGKKWIWDGTKNRYLEYDDGTEQPGKSSSGSMPAGGGTLQRITLN